MENTLSKALHVLGDEAESFNQVLVNMTGTKAPTWRSQFRRFARGETCWPKASPKARIFTLNSAPFDPAGFISKDYTIWRGPKDGKGLEGEEEQDKRALALFEVDMNSIHFENMLNEEDDEESIKGEEKILRLKAAKFIRLDARFGRDLLAEPGQATLEWLYKERGVDWFDLPGTILRNPSGRRHVLCLYRHDGRWSWYVSWLGFDCDRSVPSAVLVS